MKQIIIKNALILIVLIFTINCSKDDENTVVRSPNLEFRVQGHGLRLFEGIAFNFNDGIRISGLHSYNITNDPWGISIQVPDSVGIYMIDADPNPEQYIYLTHKKPNCVLFEGCIKANYTAVSGRIQVMRSDENRVQGIFNFVARNDNNGAEKVVHSGKFDIEL